MYKNSHLKYVSHGPRTNRFKRFPTELSGETLDPCCDANVLKCIATGRHVCGCIMTYNYEKKGCKGTIKHRTVL